MQVPWVAKYSLADFAEEREPPTSSSSSHWSSTSWWSPHSWSSNWQGRHQQSWQDDKWWEQRGERQHRLVFKMKSIPASGNWGHGYKKTSQKLLSTRTKRPDRHPWFSFLLLRFASIQTQLTERDGDVHRTPHRTRTHAHVSRAYTTAHHPHAVWAHHIGSRWKESASFFSFFTSISFLDVVTECPVRPLPFGPLLTYRIVIQTFSVYHIHGKELSQKPKRIRSLEWALPNGWLSTKHRSWTQARQLLQLHGSGAHADQYPGQPPQFPVPRRAPPWFPPVQKVYRIQEHPAAASKQQLAEFHQCSDPLVSGNRVHVTCRVVLASRKLGQSWTENLLQQRFLVHSRKGKEIETQTLCIRWKTEKISKRSLNGKLTWPSEERVAQQKLYEAEAEVEAKNWAKRNFGIAFREINQEFESQRFQLHQASRWADQAQRDKISLYGELELRGNRLFQEDHARDCQEIEELRRICCEETDQARQARIEEMSLQQQRNPTTVSRMKAQIRGLQNKVNFLVRCKRILRSWIREQLWSDPRSWSNFYFSEFQDLATLRFWIAAKYTELYGYYGKRFWTTTCSRRTTLYNLPQLKEFGIFLSGIGTWNYQIQ